MSKKPTTDNRQSWTVAAHFSDGNLSADFAREGYQDPTWRAGRIRRISPELARRAKASGAQLTVPEDDAIEDFFIPFAEPVVLPTNALVERFREQFAKEPKVRVMCLKGFEDGSLSAMFGAIDRPPSIGPNEIVDLPVSLLEACRSSGAAFTQDRGTLEVYEGRQAQHAFVLRQWREETRAEKERQARQRQAELAAAEEEARKAARRAELGI